MTDPDGRTVPDDVTFLEPGSDGYVSATSPHNSSGSQRPALVARPHDTDGVAAVVREAVRRGLRVLPQATGHGAGGTVGEDTIILDTSALTTLSIDAAARVATAGAGLTWGRINPEAEKHGLLGLSGSAPTVSIAGYTFGGGIGWLSRPHGMAAAALRSVDYVDGAGEVRHASDDAADELDREALYAFRGGGGVGIATALEFDLVPVSDLHAGYLLWPVEHLQAVVGAWSAAIGAVGDDVATSISVLHAPPAPPFPDALRGKPLVHLALAASRGASGARPLLDAVRAAAPPEVDTWGPSDAAGLARIHLDPPTAIPALGEARWLTAAAPGHAVDLLSLAASPTSPVVMLELRSVGNDAPARDGAHTRVSGPFLVHGVAALTAPEARPGIEQAFRQLREVAAPVDAGYSVGSWMEGATTVPDALPGPVRQRVAAAADRVDPAGTLWRHRFLDGPASPSR